MKITDDYVFFWGSPLSNWDYSKIVVPEIKVAADLDSPEKDAVFPTAEHYFMYLKAMTFGDTDSAMKILEVPTPKEAKKLGRNVKGFKDSEWEVLREAKMLMALRAKFSQSKYHKDFLLDHKFTGKHFVEASPYDRIWGIGVYEGDPKLLNTSRWGLNLLGKCLDQVRKEILGC